MSYRWVEYEWDCETQTSVDSAEHEEGEVLDHRHGESYAKVALDASAIPEPGERFAIVLVRDDEAGRSWAYVEDGKLPDYFSDADGRNAAKVPKRFHVEVLRHAAKATA